MSELVKTNENILDRDIVSFFDLLARFDYEDKQKEGSLFNSGSSVSAPEGSELDKDNK
ncbi:MAG: hypothetical protein UV24_C0017G0005 [Candidatus Nomurabacteria bacterium GW2011_GWA2_42_41]|nr:MAG: hypothetical protein UV24_C0017G0005 [Candidatus Nomurabacteria bacterium GW2011_GWA2_42_41]